MSSPVQQITSNPVVLACGMMIVAGILMYAGSMDNGQYLIVTIFGLFDISYVIILFGIASLVAFVITKRTIVSYALMVAGVFIAYALVIF